MTKKLFVAIIVVLGLHLGLFFFKNYLRPGIWSDALEQDPYLAYTQALSSAEFSQVLSQADSRLFPGLPWLIFLVRLIFQDSLVSGLVISGLALLVIFWIGWRLSKSLSYAVWLTLFPPIVFEQTSKISTETVVMALLCLAYWLMAKKRFLLASFLLGYATVVRPISACLFIAMLLYLIKAKKERFKAGLIYVLFPLVLLVFNVYYWGWSGSFHQLGVYQVVGRATLGLGQLAADVARTIDWGQWRILVSGLIYLGFYGFLLKLLLEKKGDFLFKGDGKMIKAWVVLTTVFILVAGTTPMLEEIRRFMAVFFPLALLVSYKTVLKQRTWFYLSFLTVLAVLV
jgi:Gpi18-like mannosyltransferase